MGMEVRAVLHKFLILKFVLVLLFNLLVVFKNGDKITWHKIYLFKVNSESCATTISLSFQNVL